MIQLNLGERMGKRKASRGRAFCEALFGCPHLNVTMLKGIFAACRRKIHFGRDVY